jgi:hypothetical protein
MRPRGLIRHAAQTQRVPKQILVAYLMGFLCFGLSPGRPAGHSLGFVGLNLEVPMRPRGLIRHAAQTQRVPKRTPKTGCRRR